MNLIRVTGYAAWVATAAIALSACGGGGGGGGTPPVPVITPTPIGTATPGAGTLQGCNSQPSTTTGSAINGGTPAGLVRVGDNVYARPVQRNADAYVPGEVAVTTRDAARATAQSVATQFKDASVDRQLHFGALGKTTTILHTTPGNEAALIASVRNTAGVESASRVSYRFRQAAPNDPYYAMQYSASSGSWIGQWDMHFTRVAEAIGVSTGSGVKVAIVDTGADISHPDLTGKIISTKCFVTGATNPTGTDVSDLDGHGTNVAGIAAADTNNNYGFASVGDAASLMVYKVFPNPPSGGCTSSSTNPACGASSTDIASGVEDAVANGAKVINLSLGGGNCTNGVDTDTTEQNAIADALAHNVVVVAASGNSGATSLIAPACITNVIAVGATGLNDTAATSTSDSAQQYVASYSNYDSSNASWGIVAPGGDPLTCESATTNSCSTDYQHWIEHIYSSQVPGWVCSTDIANKAGDCRVLIAGTSQATPHVTGAVALMFGANAGLTPSTAKSILCSTADPVPGTMLPGNGTTKPAIAAGCGALDAYRAVYKAAHGTDPGGTGGFGT